MKDQLPHSPYYTLNEVNNRKLPKEGKSINDIQIPKYHNLKTNSSNIENRAVK